MEMIAVVIVMIRIALLVILFSVKLRYLLKSES